MPITRVEVLSLSDAVGRRELFAWLACLLLANQVISVSAEALLAKSVFYYLGWYASLTLILAGDRHQPASRLDVAVSLSTALLNLVPAKSANWLSITAVAVFLSISDKEDRALKASGAVLFALAFNGFWGPKFFDVFAYYLLRADAVLVGSALSLTQPGLSWNETIIGRPDVHSVVIFSPCSSFHNLSLGLLCWVSITKLIRPSWARGDFVVALLVCLSVVLFNACRLYLMALSSEHYTYWHQGTGEQLIAWATTMTVVLISLWGAMHLGRG